VSEKVKDENVEIAGISLENEPFHFLIKKGRKNCAF